MASLTFSKSCCENIVFPSPFISIGYTYLAAWLAKLSSKNSYKPEFLETTKGIPAAIASQPAKPKPSWIESISATVLRFSKVKISSRSSLYGTILYND